MTNFRPGIENDRGYYSDRTYESPVCEQGHTAERDIVDYPAERKQMI